MDWKYVAEVLIAFSEFFMWLITFWLAGVALITPEAMSFDLAGYPVNGFGLGVFLMYLNYTWFESMDDEVRGIGGLKKKW